MAATAIPEDVAAHFQAAIQLSNRRVQMRLLKEAETVLGQNAPKAAVVIAFAVLESALEGVPPERYPAEMERWRALRNAAVHSDCPELKQEEALEVVDGIRELLAELVPLMDSSQSEPATAVSQLRGKYKYVPTSSAAFIQRKAEEIDLEH